VPRPRRDRMSPAPGGRLPSALDRGNGPQVPTRRVEARNARDGAHVKTTLDGKLVSIGGPEGWPAKSSLRVEPAAGTTQRNTRLSRYSALPDCPLISRLSFCAIVNLGVRTNAASSVHKQTGPALSARIAAALLVAPLGRSLLVRARAAAVGIHASRSRRTRRRHSFFTPR